MAGDSKVKVKATKAAKAEKKEKSDKPKRAPSAFIIFSNEHRESVKKANPDATFGGIGKLLGDAWKELDDKGKAVSVSDVS